MTFFLILYWALSLWDYHSGTAPGWIFHAFAAISSIFNNNIIFLPHSQATFGTKCKQIFRRKRSQWNYYTNFIVELPLVEWGSAAVPKLFSIFHAFAACQVFFVLIYSFQDSQATFGAKCRSINLKIPCTGHCPSGITMLEQPWPRRAKLQCPSILHYFCMFLQLIAFFCSLYILQ